MNLICIKQIKGRKCQLGDFRLRCSVLSPQHSGPGTEGELIRPTNSAEPGRVLSILLQTPSRSETYSSEQSRCMPTSSKIGVRSVKSIQDINEKRSCHCISQNIKMKNYLVKHITLTASPASANSWQHVPRWQAALAGYGSVCPILQLSY